jgi:hypothetical protein
METKRTKRATGQGFASIPNTCLELAAGFLSIRALARIRTIDKRWSLVKARWDDIAMFFDEALDIVTSCLSWKKETDALSRESHDAAAFFQDFIGRASVRGGVRGLRVRAQGHWPRFVKAQFSNLERLELTSQRLFSPLEPKGDWNCLKTLHLEFTLCDLIRIAHCIGDYSNIPWPQLPSLQNIRLHLRVLEEMLTPEEKRQTRDAFFVHIVNQVLSSSSNLSSIDIFLSGLFLFREDRNVLPERRAIDLIETQHSGVKELTLNFDLEGVGFPRVDCACITLTADEEEGDMIGGVKEYGQDMGKPGQWVQELAQARTKILVLDNTEGCLKRTDVYAPMGVEKLVVKSNFINQLVLLPGATMVHNLQPSLKTLELIDMDLDRDQYVDDDSEGYFKEGVRGCQQLDELRLVSTQCDASAFNCGCPVLPDAQELPSSVRRLIIQGLCARSLEAYVSELLQGGDMLVCDLDYIELEMLLADCDRRELVSSDQCKVEVKWRRHQDPLKAWVKFSK